MADQELRALLSFLDLIRYGLSPTSPKDSLGDSWRRSDLLMVRNRSHTTSQASFNHMITAVGSSSLSKGEAFVSKNVSDSHPKPFVYDSYEAVYNDPNVDAVYIGTPHSLHNQNCLDAIAAGKNFLCEKPFTINSREARQVLAAAKEKGVFVMEAMWTRFHPLTLDLRKQLFKHKIIGDMRRTYCDFG